MKMVTTCPACATSFRVTPQHLQVQQGTVRCGRCGHVFDAFQSLVTTPGEDGATPAPEAVSAATTVEPALEAVSPALSAEPIPQFIMPPDTAAPNQRGLTFGLVLMLAALMVQAIYFWRDEISANFPMVQSPLEKTCAILHCTVALPQRTRDLTVEGSDMRAPDPTAPGFLTLTATLRNHAMTALGYPALDIALINNDDHTVARRIFLPRDYLRDNHDVRVGIAPNAEVTVALNLDTGDLGASGFRIDLLPTP